MAPQVLTTDVPKSFGKVTTHSLPRPEPPSTIGSYFLLSILHLVTRLLEPIPRARHAEVCSAPWPQVKEQKPGAEAKPKGQEITVIKAEQLNPNPLAPWVNPNPESPLATARVSFGRGYRLRRRGSVSFFHPKPETIEPRTISLPHFPTRCLGCLTAWAALAAWAASPPWPSRRLGRLALTLALTLTLTLALYPNLH